MKLYFSSIQWERITGKLEENLRRVIGSLDKELEEKVFQMSQIRLVAEIMSEGIQDLHYFESVCTNIMEMLSASNCHIYWNRKREPAGWWRDTQANRDDADVYGSDIIPEGDEWIFGWVKLHKNPLYLDSSGDDGSLIPPHQNPN